MVSSVARALFWSILGTHVMSSLNGSVRSASGRWESIDLIPTLRATFSGHTAPGRAVTDLDDIWSTETDLWRTSDYCSRRHESIWLPSHLVVNDLLLFDYGGLIAWPHLLWFLYSLSTTRVRAKVSDLADMAATTTNWFLIGQQNTRNIV